MRRSPSKLLFFGFMTLFMLMIVGGYNTTPVSAQTAIPVTDAQFVNDKTLYVYASLDGKNLKDSPQGDPVLINMDDPMVLFLQVNVSDSLAYDLNMSGSITFYYQGIPIFPIQIVDYATNSTWISVANGESIPVIETPIGLGQAFQISGFKIATGIFQASINFRYYLSNDTTTEHVVSNVFFFKIPSTPTDVITSVTGISAGVATVSAVYATGNGFWSLFEGLKTAYKLRGIHKKASEIRSLPNMTVIGALPLLFSMLAGITKMSKKKKDETPEDSGVSEYIVRQRIREVAPDAWPADKCPKCKRNWNTKLDTCKKCNISADEARVEYADLLASKVPTALKVMGKKKSADIRTLAKKTKSTDYNAGVIAAAMVDTGVTEIVKVGTPFRSFIMNIAGLAFLVVTWQQLLGDNASTFQTTITIVGAAMSLAVIIALYVSRKTQVEKFHSDMDEGKKWMPTEEEAAAEAEADAAKEETQETEVVEDEPDTDDLDSTPEVEEGEHESLEVDESEDVEGPSESEEAAIEDDDESEVDSLDESSND